MPFVLMVRELLMTGRNKSSAKWTDNFFMSFSLLQEIYDLLLPEQKQDFVISARVKAKISLFFLQEEETRWVS